MKLFKTFTLISLFVVLGLNSFAVGNITKVVIKAETGTCLPSGDYQLKFNIRGTDLPNVSTMSLIVEGDEYEDVPVVFVNSTKLKVNTEIRSRGRANPDLFVIVEPGNTFLKLDFIAVEPPCSNAPCDITDVTDVSTSPDTLGQYDATITFNAVGLPDSVDLFIKKNGIDIKFLDLTPVSLGAGAYSLTSGKIDDTGATGLDIFIRAESGCTKFESNAFNEPSISSRLAQGHSDILQVFPNPSTGNITITTTLKEPHLEVRNILGQLIEHPTVVAGGRASFTGLKPGIYLVTIHSQDLIETHKLIIQ